MAGVPIPRPPIPMPTYMAPPGANLGGRDPHQGGGLLGNVFSWNGNPIYEALKTPAMSDMLIAMGSGLMQGPNLSQGLARGSELYTQMLPDIRAQQEQQRQLKEQQKAREGTARAILGMGKDPNDPFYRDLADTVSIGGVDVGQGFNTALQYQTQAKQKAEQLAKAKGAAQFIKDPALSAAVANGALSFNDAYQLTKQRGFRPLTADEAQAYGLDSPAGYQVDEATGNIDHITGTNTGADPGDIGVIADAIVSGQQPPTTQGFYGNTVALRAELAKRGFDLTRAQQDMAATTRLLSTLNGPQQVPLRQAVAFTKDSLPQIEQMAQEWDAGQFPALNKANLELAKQGVYGQQAASLATRLEAQINDMTSELGTVYKGGNSSTDESLKLAASNLNVNWSKQTLLDAIKQIRQNLTYRENSLNLMPTAGIPDSNYNPMTTQGQPHQPGGMPSGAPGDAAPVTATNPQTGQQLVLQNGQWVPAQ